MKKTELEQLEAKRDEMRSELAALKPMQVKHPGVVGRIMKLSVYLADCNKMIGVARVNAVNKGRTTQP